MRVLPKSVEKVIDEFQRLPGVGAKSAARMAYHYLRSTTKDATKLAESLIAMDESVQFCKSCFSVSEKVECDICSSKLRDQTKLCVVEEVLDVVAFEDSGVYSGLYFVLGGVISPADGISAEEIRLKELKTRIDSLIGNSGNSIGIEVIVATNPSLEGEATAAYITDLLVDEIKNEKVRLSRIAMGLPTGADLQYADRLTLKRALEGRSKI